MPNDLVTVLEKLAGEELREPPSRRAIGEKAVRWFELALVLLVAFGDSFVRTAMVRPGAAPSGPIDPSRWAGAIAREVVSLLLLGYVLFRRGRTIRDLGVRWSWGALAMGVVLAVGAYLTYAISCWPIYRAVHSIAPGALAATPHQLFGHASSLMFAMSVINPFFEELIVRAFLMTEVRALTGSWTLAVVASTAVQTSYHLYYGWTGALCVGVQFLLFSLYYAKTRRAVPVIVAHGILDLIAAAMLMR